MWLRISTDVMAAASITASIWAARTSNKNRMRAKLSWFDAKDERKKAEAAEVRTRIIREEIDQIMKAITERVQQNNDYTDTGHVEGER